MDESKPRRLSRTVFGVVACFLVLVAGLGLFRALAAMKVPPVQAQSQESPLGVSVKQVQPEDIPVTLTGYGEVRCLHVVSIAPEVNGLVTHIHPNLEVGGIIPAGETLFSIDARDYEARLGEARASVAMSRNAIERLNGQHAVNVERLATLKRSMDLTRTEFERTRELFENDQVGTLSSVEQSERAFNTVSDQVKQLAEAVDLYPVRLHEAENALAAAQARLELSLTAYERTTVTAPFTARVRMVAVRAGQYVSPGAPVLTIADDTVLEISVPLDSREAQQWLQFSQEETRRNKAWFRNLEPVPCTIHWTEESEGHQWQGLLHRVEKFDEQTRTVTVAVRIEGEDAQSLDPDRLPLVAGMFCKVLIPGRTLHGAFRIPEHAVSYDGNVYLVVENRLRTVQVERTLILGEDAVITKGLSPGDVVVTTRLVNPLENALLAVMESPVEGSVS